MSVFWGVHGYVCVRAKRIVYFYHVCHNGVVSFHFVLHDMAYYRYSSLVFLLNPDDGFWPKTELRHCNL